MTTPKNTLPSLRRPAGQLSQTSERVRKLHELTEELLNDNFLATLDDDSWVERLLAWADEFHIDHKTLPRTKQELLALTELDLKKERNSLYKDKEVTYLPPEIGQLQQLQDLNLYDNQLTQLPAEIGQLQQLQVLVLWGNQLSQQEQQRVRQLLPNCIIIDYD